MPRIADPRFAPDCHIDFDGHRVAARQGESVAAALLAAGRPLLARSAKYHRPRGPFCLTGSCGSCLVRAGGEPNRRACRTRCRDGLAVESQNTLGGADRDLLAAVDRLYARGLDHHRLMTWSRLANRAAVAISRQLAGLGKLSEAAPPPSPAAEEARFDAIVVGAGPAGLGAAEALAAAGRRVLLADEAPVAGGRLRAGLALPGDPPRAWVEGVCAAVRGAGGEGALGTSAAGLWRDGGTVLALARDGEPSLRLARAPRVVLATGAWPQPPDLDDGDLPGVFAARGLLALLLEDGVVPGRRVAVLGLGPEAEAVLARLRAAGVEAVQVAEARAAHGRRGRVAALELPGGARVTCDAVAAVGPGLPAAELARLAGARLAFDPASGGFRLAGPGPLVAPGVHAAGELVAPGDAAAAVASGRRAGEAALG